MRYHDEILSNASPLNFMLKSRVRPVEAAVQIKVRRVLELGHPRERTKASCGSSHPRQNAGSKGDRTRHQELTDGVVDPLFTSTYLKLKCPELLTGSNVMAAPPLLPP